MRRSEVYGDRQQRRDTNRSVGCVTPPRARVHPGTPTHTHTLRHHAPLYLSKIVPSQPHPTLTGKRVRYNLILDADEHQDHA